jgi:hypothetical protein
LSENPGALNSCKCSGTSRPGKIEDVKKLKLLRKKMSYNLRRATESTVDRGKISAH